MVKSKKMSKGSLAVIILAVLLVLSMVLGLTGAWFTDKKNKTIDNPTLSFGKIGKVSIELAGATWTDKTGKELTSADRAYVMPGDNVKGGKISITYTTVEGDEAKVYYVIEKKATDSAEASTAKYYTLDSTSGLVEIAGETKSAGELTAAITLDKTSEFVKVTVGEKSVEVKSDNAELLTNAFEGANQFDFLGIESGAYEVRIIQSTNMTATEAYTYLTTKTVESKA